MAPLQQAALQMLQRMAQIWPWMVGQIRFGSIFKAKRRLQFRLHAALPCEASAMDPAGPVELTVDVGSQRKLSAVDIEWEFPAKSFALSVSTDGVKWSEVHSTDSNVLDSSHISLGLVPAAKIKLVMHEVCSCSATPSALHCESCVC